jgi:hypothetical protein
MIRVSRHDRPPASPDRERDARELFPIAEMTPEEYAARYGDGWYCFSFDDYSYSDPELDRWIQHLGEVLPGRVTPFRVQ